MAQKSMNELLKWGIENSTSSPSTDTNADPANSSAAPTSSLNPELLAQLFGGPSEADLMRAAVEHIQSSDPEITLESRLTAFDNLEQLVESLDNANNLSKLGLWTPLLDLLAHDEAQIRLMAAWCVGTAVQNNEPCQERLVALGGVERLVGMALGERAVALEESSNGDDAAEKKQNGEGEGKREEDKEVRRKAVYALSSAIRNYQPAADVCTSELRKKGEQVDDKIDATDMEAINGLIDSLKQKAANA